MIFNRYQAQSRVLGSPTALVPQQEWVWVDRPVLYRSTALLAARFNRRWWANQGILVETRIVNLKTGKLV